MDESKNRDKKSSSDFFLPLTGREKTSRLEEKFEHYFDSDEDSEPNEVSSKGKVSQWKLDSPSKWLHSQSHRGREKPAVVTGGREIQRSPRGKKRTQRQGPTKPENKQSASTSGLARSKKSEIKGPSGQSDSSSKEHHSNDRNRGEDINEWSSDDSSPETYSIRRLKSSCKRSSPDDKDTGSDTGGRAAKAKPKHVIEEDKNSWAGFSLSDTERPKLGIVPVSAKVDFQLSFDASQPPVKVPATINRYLRDYQREGIRFLYDHYAAKTGAILGDDMGLGKTIQVIAFLAALLGKQGNHMDTLHAIPKFIRQMSDDLPDSPPRRACKPFLIIGPSAVMYNWLDELNTWGYFTASKFHGADKDVCLNDLKRGKLEIVVTTFETFRDNVARLNEVEWEAVIVDEVHKIKGLKAQVTQALRIINTPCRYGLTGTALQNNMTELWSLLDWAQHGVLGTLEQFDTDFVEVIETGQRHDASKRELALARKQRDKFSEIRRKMLLRRTKALIADQLPTKEDLVVMCRLTDLQVSVYKAILNHPDMDLVLRAEDPCDCRSGKLRASCCHKFAADGTKAWALVFSYMHLMLKAANHTALLIPDHNTKKKQADLARKVCEIAFKDHPQFLEQARSAAFRTLSDPKYCGKMKILQGLLSVFYASHDKVLIFSYSTRLLDIIEQYVISQGHNYRRIDGQVSSQRRRDIVIQFNTDSSIFLCLISTKAGGLGLNLTGANRVVVFDPNWNPSHDLQAQDRAYRIGQTRDVKVYRLVSAGTIEENIYLRQIYKQQLDEVAIGTGNARRYFLGIQGDRENQGELFGVKNMFSLRTGNSCLTMDILKRNEKVEKGLAGYDITKYVPPQKDSSKDSPSENSEEDSDTDERSLIDPDQEEEEDEEFLKQLFGSERSPIRGTDVHAANQIPSTSKGRRTIQDTTKPSGLQNVATNNADSDNSDDEEFSLIPRLHHKPPHVKSGKSGKPCALTDEGGDQPATSSTPPDSAGASLPCNDTFLASDITFSSTTCRASAAPNQQQFKDATSGIVTRKRGAVSGISWLFSDDDDSDEENIKEDDDTSENKELNETGVSHHGKQPAKARSSAKDASRTKKQANSVNTSRGSRESDVSSKPKSSKPSTAKSRTPKFTSVQSVLESGGVLHTHVNPQIIGSSRAEDHMTRCAMQDVFELHTNTQAPALLCDPYSQSEEVKEAAKSKSKKVRGKAKEDHNSKRCVKFGSFKLLIGQTPVAIGRQQWSDLCKSRGVDQLELAETLLTADVDKRLDILKEFYSERHPQLVEALAQLYTLTQAGPSRVKDSGDGHERKSSHRDRGTTPSRRRQNVTRDDTASSNHSDEPTSDRPNSREYPYPSSRKAQTPKKSKRPPASMLFDMDTLSSQESITAFTPENQDLSPEDEPDNFLPVPPSSRKRNPRNNISPYKTQSRTRLRQKPGIRYEDGDERNDRTGNTDVRDHGADLHLEDGLSTNLSRHSRAVVDSTMKDRAFLQPEEDISSLLQEIGHGASSQGREGRKNQQKANVDKERSKNFALVSDETHQGDTSMLPRSDIQSVSKQGAKPKSKDEKQAASGTKQKKFACVLDDIFCSSLDEASEDQPSPSKKSKLGETKNPQHKNVKDAGPSTSRIEEANSDLSSQTEKETFDLFDDLLTTSTLKDERVDCFSRPTKTRREGKSGRGPTSESSKRKEEKEYPRQRYQQDVDDLDWCNVNLSSAQHEDGSESLFS